VSSPVLVELSVSSVRCARLDEPGIRKGGEHVDRTSNNTAGMGFAFAFTQSYVANLREVSIEFSAHEMTSCARARRGD